jgi:hypothetical protein
VEIGVLVVVSSFVPDTILLRTVICNSPNMTVSHH